MIHAYVKACLHVHKHAMYMHADLHHEYGWQQSICTYALTCTHTYTQLCGHKGGKRSVEIVGADERRVLDAHKLIAYVATWPRDVKITDWCACGR